MEEVARATTEYRFRGVITVADFHRLALFAQ
jgi:hypothetical protein